MRSHKRHSTRVRHMDARNPEFGFLSGLYSQIQNILFIQYDVLPKMWSLTGAWMVQYLPTRFSGEISHSVLFFLTFNIISQVLALPPSYYSTFVLEEKFGFNKQTLRLWLTDMLKGQASDGCFGYTTTLGIPQNHSGDWHDILLLSLRCFRYASRLFAITDLSHSSSLPLFNKLSPLEDGKLKSGVESLADGLKFPLSSLYVIDGSKRSAHSNAYFFGLPWKKHIVIYDTLIEKSEPQEVVAVLGHELGHWSLSHTTKLFGIAQVCPLLHTFLYSTDLDSSTCSTSSRSSPSSSTTTPSTRHSASTTSIPSSSDSSYSLTPLHLSTASSNS